MYEKTGVKGHVPWKTSDYCRSQALKSMRIVLTPQGFTRDAAQLPSVSSKSSFCEKLSVRRKYFTERGHNSITTKVSGGGTTFPSSLRPPGGGSGNATSLQWFKPGGAPQKNCSRALSLRFPHCCFRHAKSSAEAQSAPTISNSPATRNCSEVFENHHTSSQ
mmetsp:Transcript_58977/g.118426  ORF Transcript_58977/g.118426 Transcript_58977/m.118426 type:complete len:162 (+) Transcript_58977:177-662(+)